MGVVGVPGAEGEGEGREVADDAWVAAVEVFGQGIGEVVVAWWGWLCVWGVWRWVVGRQI